MITVTKFNLRWKSCQSKAIGIKCFESESVIIYEWWPVNLNRNTVRYLWQIKDLF